MNMTRLWSAALCAAVFLAAGCGGSSSQGADHGGSTGAVKKGGILRVGTIDRIDSLNPFAGIETQAYNAYVMEYPQLVQYGPGLKLVGDWATSWSHSSDGRTWTFRLKPGARWSDGKPMTSADVTWTGNTIVKYRNGATATLAPALDHVTRFTAPDPDTVVIHYAKAAGNVLAQLEQFWILPKHVWDRYTGNDGRDLKDFLPEQHLPTVAGGPYEITQYQEKGTTVFKPNPYFYGPTSNADAVALIYYTNATSMIVDLEGGQLDFVDQVPFSAVGTLKGNSRLTLSRQPGGEVTNITFNSNLRKAKNRELLDPKVKQALEYATDRRQIADVVYDGYAKPWANILSEQSKGAGWLNPAVQPLPYEPARANQILDQLGYKRGANGVRVVPATSGRYAQATHPMSYDIMVPSSLDFNGDREFQILKSNWAQVGVQVNEVAGGDSSQAYNYETAPNGKYLSMDMALWDWVGYIDPDFLLSVLTKAQWNSWSDTGFDDPNYDRWYQRQGTLIDPKARRTLVWQMEKFIAEQRPYIQLVDENLITAWDKQWTGFQPDLDAYCKCYYTSPHQS